MKLHTGQGKTLIGLLILQSRLNAGSGAAVYLCPDNFLIAQTCEQARQFGIGACVADPELPDDFLNGQKMLVTSVQKLFNGLTKFGLYKDSLPVGTMVMDDAHACADRVREQCRIRIPNGEPAYEAIKTLFAQELEMQGVGTYADICNGRRGALLPIPYWAWISKETEVAVILSDNSHRDSVRFAWPLLKDNLGSCQGVVSGAAVEIEPYVAPLSAFGSYWNAAHRVFMSATVTDDAFLVKGLRLSPETIMNPLGYEKETWSGEKMVLLPSLIHQELDRSRIVELFAPPKEGRSFGVVALTPSFPGTTDWAGYGAAVATRETLGCLIEKLRAGAFKEAVVLANRYDGIDLPDDACRILVFDSRPFSESLTDLYQEACRPNSEATLMRTIRTVEQGMGRSVRGEKDYCVIVAIGTDLMRLIRGRESRKHLSSQMAAQIEIGVEVAGMARQEVEEGTAPIAALKGLVSQCLRRDADWKAFYVERMSKVKPKGANERGLRLYAAELAAEEEFLSGNYTGAVAALQKSLDGGGVNQEDRAWYLQEMARYNFGSNRVESQRLQIAAHKGNRFLLKPASGVTVAKLAIQSQGRVDRIAKWVGGFASYSELDVAISDVLGRLVFGTKAEKFEDALDGLSKALGFAGERPDKEWKEGPDNLWALDSAHYLLWECKSEVEVTRAEINKREAEQMNRSAAWFEKHYQAASVKRIIIHPSNLVQSAAALTHEVEAMREKELKHFVTAAREFYKSFENQNLRDLSTAHIQKMIDAHHLSVGELLSSYSRKLKDLKSRRVT